jgi:hypothetical protein
MNMRRLAFWVAVCGLTLGGAAVTAGAAQFVVVLRPGGTSWKVVEAEKITFNGKDRLRYGASKKLDLGPDDYKRLPADPIVLSGTVRMHAGGYLVRREGGDWLPVAPDGANVKGATSYPALWSSATASLQSGKDAKAATAVGIADLFAVLQAGTRTRDEVITSFIEDEHNFQGVGENDAESAFKERMSLLVGVAGSVGGAQGTRLQALLVAPMEAINTQLSAGIAQYADLQRGLGFAEYSEAAYPNDERQKAVRAALRDKKDSLERRMAILKALDAGKLWDAFLEKYGDFERWENSFEEFPKMRQKAYQESARQHRTEGERLYELKQFERALTELKLAQLHAPGDKELAKLVEKVGIDEEVDHSSHVKARVLTPAEERLVMRHLVNAENDINDTTRDHSTEAAEELAVAEGIDPGSPEIMYVRARLQEKNNELQKALDTLDSYSRRVTSLDDIHKGETLAGDIRHQLQTKKESLKAAIQKAEADGDYVAAMQDAEQGLAFDSQDLDFLLHAGTNGLILRRNADAQKWFQQYLQLSQVPGSDAKVRTQVLNWTALSQIKTPEPDGKPNWFSGYKSPAGLFYCPESLAPNAHIVEVKGSRGLAVSFDWNKDVLTKVHTAQDNAHGGIDSSTIYFDYFKNQTAVRRVGKEAFAPAEDPGTPRFTPSGPVGTGKATYTALPNHPVVDPLMVERLTGKSAAAIVTGNPYFNPFVWDGVYSFMAEYDEQGRVKSARQVGVETGKAPHEFDFKWDGWRLTEIAERGGSGYRRSMTYNGNKLIGETISFGGKTVKIDYRYQGEQLVEASSGDDPSIDGRNRHVTFR